MLIFANIYAHARTSHDNRTLLKIFRQWIVSVGASDNTFTMACPFGDWQIFQDFFGVFFYPAQRFGASFEELIWHFLPFRFNTMSIAMFMLGLKCVVYTIYSRQESTNTAQRFDFTHICVDFPCINAKLNSAVCMHTYMTVAFGWILETGSYDKTFLCIACVLLWETMYSFLCQCFTCADGFLFAMKVLYARNCELFTPRTLNPWSKRNSWSEFIERTLAKWSGCDNYDDGDATVW